VSTRHRPFTAAAILLAVGALACAGAVRGSYPARCPDNFIPASSPGYTAPRPLQPFSPPLPIPADVRGQRAVARVLVDTAGVPVRDSISVCGLPNEAYAKEIGWTLLQLRFEPARQDGFVRRAPAFVSYEFEQR
jgi:hypothetical protein